MLGSLVSSSSPWMGRWSASETLWPREFRSAPRSWGRVSTLLSSWGGQGGGIRSASQIASITISASSVKQSKRTKSSISTHSATVCWPPARSMCNRRHSGQRPKAVAVIDERLGARRQGFAGRSRAVTLLKHTYQPIARIRSKPIANQDPVAVNRRPRVVRQTSEPHAEVTLNAGRLGTRQPAPGSLEPARLRVLVVDLAAWTWPTNTLAAPDRVDNRRQPCSTSTERRARTRGDHARFIAPAASLRGPAALGGETSPSRWPTLARQPAARRTSARESRPRRRVDRRGSIDRAGGHPPRRFVQVMGGQEYRPRGSPPESRSPGWPQPPRPARLSCRRRRCRSGSRP